MRCIKCGAEMIQQGASLVCAATGSDLSDRAVQQLNRIVQAPQLAFEPAKNPEMKWGCEWFCPADGQPLREANATLVCDECDRVIPAPLIYQLIEFNLHP